MKITTKRIKEMQRMLLELESDIWEDFHKTEDRTKVKEEHRQRYQNARFNLIKAWNALDELIPPWEE